MRQPLFSMTNVHADSAGTPPVFVNNDADRYHGYFENRHGEQWVFTYDRSAEQAVLVGGDADWQRPHQVVDGKVPGLALSPEEIEWLAACWRAATRA